MGNAPSSSQERGYDNLGSECGHNIDYTQPAKDEKAQVYRWITGGKNEENFGREEREAQLVMKERERLAAARQAERAAQARAAEIEENERMIMMMTRK